MSWQLYAVVLLGVFHGVNPFMGWLFSLFMGLLRGRALYCILSSLAISIGHTISIALTVAGFALLRTLVGEAVVTGLSLILIVWGLALFANKVKHVYLGLNLGLPLLGLWGLIMGFLHGAGIAFASIVIINDYVGLSNMLPLIVAHFASAFFAMSTTSSLLLLFYESRGASLLKRFTGNYSSLWAILLVAMGLSLLVLQAIKRL